MRIAAKVLVAHDEPFSAWIEHHPPDTTDGTMETFELVVLDSYEVQVRSPSAGKRGVRLGMSRRKSLDRATVEAPGGQPV